MAFPPIPVKKLKAFASKKSDGPIKKMTKPKGGDDEHEDDEEKKDHDEGEHEDKPKGVDLKAAEDGAAAHDDDEIEEAMKGYDPEVDGNPPGFVDEATWEKAKKAVQPKWDDYDEPYAVLSYVYKQMGGKFSKKKG
jgi:hypothetical protein